MAELPTGTVTFLFTDIEGSTRLLEEHGERYAHVLEGHRRVLRDAFERHGGVEVDTQGDAFFVAFTRASDAAAAAQEAQRELELPVRMGIHTGEPQLSGGGYVGIDVHRAARICAAAQGGQVVVSEATQRLFGGTARLIDLGLHRLKDIGELRLYQLGDGEFPPLRSLNQTNLPIPHEPLIGRKKELADVLRLVRVDEARVATITGPGGIGKTRFALEVAAELVEDFRDGAWFVDLSAVRDPELVLPTIAGMLVAKVELVAHIGDRELLLVLDNLEQVIEAAPQLASLLERCPNLRLLATSREPLHVRGERRYPLRPLAEPPAVELFRQRAQALDPDFDAPYDLLAELCRRLDNLPLALELAAARTRMLSVPQLLERLDERLPLLTSRSRDAPERQRTLRATIEWSYDLLEPAEQRLFRRLSVFTGAFTLASAEEVCGAGVDSLESLVEKSLVRDGERFAILETIRDYAAERLEETPESAALRQRHAELFVKLAEVAERQLLAGDQTASVRWFAEEAGNVGTALEWALREDETLEVRLVAALAHFWILRGEWSTARRWLDHALDRAAEPAGARAKALQEAALLARLQHDLPRARALAEQGLILCKRAEDWSGAARCLITLAAVAGFEGDWESARRLAGEGQQLAISVGDDRTAGFAFFNLADAALFLGRHSEAWRNSHEALRLFRGIGHHEGVALALSVAGLAAAQEGKRDDAEEALREGLSVGVGLGFPEPLSWCLDAVAALASAPETAATLVGTAERLREGFPARPTVEEIHEDTSRALREGLGTDRFEALRSEGRQMEVEQAVMNALASID